MKRFSIAVLACLAMSSLAACGSDVGDACSGSGDCSGDAYCCTDDHCRNRTTGQGICTFSCNDDRDCPDDSICRSDRCLLSCSTDRDCDTGFECKEKDGRLACEGH